MRSGDPRGFAFVRYMDQRDADAAIDRLDGERLGGREIRIQVPVLLKLLNPSCYKKISNYCSSRVSPKCVCGCAVNGTARAANRLLSDR